MRLCLLRLWQRGTHGCFTGPNCFLVVEMPTPGSKCFQATGREMVKPGHLEILERRAQREKPFISLLK